MTLDELQNQIEAAIQANDIQKLEDLAENYLQIGGDAKYPFSIPLQFSDQVTGQEFLTESNSAIPIANGISRARRRIAYNLKLRGGYRGPKIVAEGDSWFEYPILLDDVLDHLMNDYAVYSLAGAGDLLADMANEAEYISIIQQEQPEFFLLSGGGNDMLQEGQLKEFLNTFQPGMTAAEVLDNTRFDPFLTTMLGTLKNILGHVHSKFPNLVILLHGYDYALPVQGGQWLGKPLAARKVPKSLWAPVVRILIDKYNAQLKALESLFPGRVFHIDCRGSVGDNVSFWHDELHPKDDGYGRAAQRFKERIEAIRTANTMGPTVATVEMANESPSIKARRRKSIVGVGLPVSRPECTRRIMQGQEPIPQATIDDGEDFSTVEAIISPEARQRDRGLAPTPNQAALEAWRKRLTAEDRKAYDHYLTLMQRDPEIDRSLVEARMEMSSQNDPFTIERIVGDSNLYQINYLSRGERASKAVGRVNVISKFGLSLGSGTGFLIAPGLLITNNHVLKQADMVQKSYVVFEFEYDAENQLKSTSLFRFTKDLFFTSKELDFSIVSVSSKSDSGRDLSEFGYLHLLEQSGKALPHEFVSIIQHPGGATKQLALRDSEILGRIEQYLYYTTDTNPGSSGAPVLNDEWFPVALHHRSVPDFDKPNSFVANRGIRISSIMQELSRAGQTDPQARKIYEIINQSTGSESEVLDSTIVSSPTTDGQATTEALKEPFREPFTTKRKGYDKDYLGIEVPLPTIRPQFQSIAAPLKGSTETVLKYEHFSVVMHKERRLALFTASNVDAADKLKRPDPSRPASDYTRKGLTGLAENDQEKWYEDPRLESRYQLPDRFYTKDNGSYDKGHLVRREDVVWGYSYEEMRRSNGDTYFMTNCSPQVANFNRSNMSGEWGKLENMIGKQAKAEKLTLFAGPVLDPSDKKFRGKDNEGEVLVQIPVKFWKLIVAQSGNKLQAFAFLLEQDLSAVNLEFEVGEEWRHRMISVSALEGLVRYFRFPGIVREADQFSEM
jgi:endonuclease G, mitochondrial